MIRKSGGCTTTAFAMTVGPDSDPMIKIRLEVIESWLQVLVETSVPMEAIRRAWGRLRASLEGPRRWASVKGPMAAVIATLVDLRWRPLEPDKWEDEQDTVLEIDPRRAGVVPQVAAAVRQRCREIVWSKAEEHHGGGGLGVDVDCTVFKRMRDRMVKDGDPKNVGIVDLIPQGAAWPPARQAAAFGTGLSPVCEFCKAATGTLRHQIWGCPVIQEKIGVAREESKEYEHEALKDAIVDERRQLASWARGVPPLSAKSAGAGGSCRPPAPGPCGSCSRTLATT